MSVVRLAAHQKDLHSSQGPEGLILGEQHPQDCTDNDKLQAHTFHIARSILLVLSSTHEILADPVEWILEVEEAQRLNLL